MAAVRDSETSAESMGIHIAYTKTLAFGISAAFTGLAGGLFAHKIGYLAPDAFTLATSIQLLLLVVVGGLGSMHGVIYGARFHRPPAAGHRLGSGCGSAGRESDPGP